MTEGLWLFFAMAYACDLSQYMVDDRRRMMILRTATCGLFAVYMFATGAHTGAIADLIAGFGCLLQAAIPDRMLASTKAVRAALAISMAVIAAIFCAGEAGDILPLLAVINGRLVEMQACTQRIKMGMVVSQILWIGYFIQQGLTLMYFAELLALTLNLTSIWMCEQKRRKAILVRI